MDMNTNALGLKLHQMTVKFNLVFNVEYQSFFFLLIEINKSVTYMHWMIIPLYDGFHSAISIVITPINIDE
ncbi:unnamed protein product [Rotaria sordida]|uniref:Uncharacterized protein n=1 Tax=Rotaria sordida TaxID=392033 RepID=A0A819UC94_9BILA|nr:unnamed protein product [Rotaria sordida]CAF4086537.1 unnamed protein product [Rotaria sordida]